MTVRIYALEKFINFTVCSLGGMTDPVVGVFFETDSLDCYSLSSGGQLAVWESSLDLANLEPGQPTKNKKKVKKEEEPENLEEEEEEGQGEEAVKEGMGESSQAETIQVGENVNQTSRLVYKRSSRHFLRFFTL
jgi:hypothetical protein